MTHPRPAPSVLRLRSDLRACMADGLCYCAMVGIGETYLAAFVLRLGLGPVAAGLILTVPVVLGAVLQLASPALVRRVGSYPRWTALCAYAQGAMYVPLALIALAGPAAIDHLRDAGMLWIATAAIFIVATLYWTAGLACGPAWNTLAGVIVPAAIRANYFARRTRWLQLATLAGLLAHGWVVETTGSFLRTAPWWPEARDPLLPGFAAAFLIAGLFRVVSGWYLSRYSDPPHPPDAERHVHLADFFKRFRAGRDGRFLAYVVAVGIAAQIAQPFFNPYMIDQLSLSSVYLIDSFRALGPAYGWFLAASFLGKVIAVPTAGRLAERFGPRPLLIVGGVGLVPLPLLWLATDNLSLLIVAQIVSGMLWGTWELAVFLLNYETIRPDERTSVLTHFNLANELAKTGGSLIGGAGLDIRGKDAGAYAAIFWISAAARLLTLVLLARVRAPAPEEKKTQVIDSGPLAVRSGAGSVDEPLLTDPPTRHQ